MSVLLFCSIDPNDGQLDVLLDESFVQFCNDVGDHLILSLVPASGEHFIESEISQQKLGGLR